MSPEFPIRIIFDDGEIVELASPEELLEQVESLDSNDSRVWVRDANDQNVRVRIRNGAIELLAIER